MPVPALWDEIAVAGDVATAGGGVANALYFGRRALAGRGPRRGAALVLATTFGGAAVHAASQLAAGSEGAVAALVRAPLLAGTLGAALLIAAGARRGAIGRATERDAAGRQR
jgi:hypothetical protein